MKHSTGLPLYGSVGASRLDKDSSIFCLLVIDEEKMCYGIDTWAQCYKTFYGRNLQMFVMGLSVRPLQLLIA